MKTISIKITEYDALAIRDSCTELYHALGGKKRKPEQPYSQKRKDAAYNLKELMSTLIFTKFK